MISRISTLVVSSIFLLSATNLWADEAAIKKLVKEKVELLNQATMKGEYATIVDLTYPKIIEMMGGRAKMLEVLEKSISQSKDQGFEIKSYKVGEPSDSVKQGADLYLYVPTELTMKYKTKKITSQSFVVGISPDSGKTWTFANSDSRGSIKKVFPNLPEELKLPETRKPLVEDD